MTEKALKHYELLFGEFIVFFKTMCPSKISVLKFFSGVYSHSKKESYVGSVEDR